MMRLPTVTLALILLAVCARAQVVIIDAAPNKFTMALMMMSHNAGVPAPQSVQIFDAGEREVMVGVAHALDHDERVVGWRISAPRSIVLSTDDTVVTMWASHLLCHKTSGTLDTMPMFFDFYRIHKCTHERLGDVAYTRLVRELQKWEHFDEVMAQTPFQQVRNMSDNQFIELCRDLFRDQRKL